MRHKKKQKTKMRKFKLFDSAITIPNAYMGFEFFVNLPQVETELGDVTILLLNETDQSWLTNARAFLASENWTNVIGNQVARSLFVHTGFTTTGGAEFDKDHKRTKELFTTWQGFDDPLYIKTVADWESWMFNNNLTIGKLSYKQPMGLSPIISTIILDRNPFPLINDTFTGQPRPDTITTALTSTMSMGDNSSKNCFASIVDLGGTGDTAL